MASCDQVIDFLEAMVGGDLMGVLKAFVVVSKSNECEGVLYLL